MISISDSLNEIIKNYPLIEDGLSHGIINYSAFARRLKPQIEKRLYKKVHQGAIVMALKRISDKLIKNKQPQKYTLNLTDLTVRSKLAELTFQNSVSLPEKVSQLFQLISNKKDILCALSEGIRETTFVVSTELVSEIKKLFNKEILINQMEDLSSVTIRLPKEVIYIPGVYYQILKSLSWENINVIEVLSTYTELTIIIESKNIDKAFLTLNQKTFSNGC